MTGKEHFAVHSSSFVKSAWASTLNLSLRNLYLLGCIFGLIVGFIGIPYLQSSFRTVIDEGKSTLMIPSVEPPDSYPDRVSLERQSEDLSDSKGASDSHPVNSSGRINEVTRRIDEPLTTYELGGQPPSEGRTLQEPSEGQTQISERTSYSGGSSEVEEEDEEAADGGVTVEDLQKNLDVDSTPNSASNDNGQEEKEVAVITKESEEDVDASKSIKKHPSEEETGRFTGVSTLESQTKELPSTPGPAGSESGYHKRESPHVIEKNVLETAPRASDQNLVGVDTGEEGSFRRESETVFPANTSDQDGGLQLLSPNPSPMTDQCDIFKGQWIPDPLGPLYPRNSCRVASQAQNCHDNGRPDKQYEFYRWQPEDCDLPRLDPLAFLQLMEGKTLAFIGDSVARNQYESLVCILSQVGKPNNRGNKNMQRWFFPSHRFSLVRVWSGWLVRQTKEPFSFAPEDSVKLYLDELDDFASYMPKFDVAVLSSGHWWVRKTAYILGGKIRGGYGWNVKIKSKKKMDHTQAFSTAMKNVLKKIGEIPDYKGLTILRTYSPDHYEGGRWDTGGSCTGKTEPYSRNQLPKNTFNEMMRISQVDALNSTMQKGSTRRNGSSLALLDVFEAMNYRADGHPGPYRSRNPNKQTERDEKGHPPPQDCLHWCLPGPVDTMNQLLLQVLRRDFHKQ